MILLGDGKTLTGPDGTKRKTAELSRKDGGKTGTLIQTEHLTVLLTEKLLHGCPCQNRTKRKNEMSYVCKRGHKCMCFQCGEKDCEHFESESPKWVKDFFENEEIKEKLKRISESRPAEEQETKHE